MNISKVWNIFRLMCCKGGLSRAAYIQKHNLFGSMGKKCYFHPYWMPSDPKRIYIGDNVWVAANVVFINHDVAGGMLVQKNGETYKQLFEDIHIGNNVLVGANVIILPGVWIEDNCVIGAGSVVSKNIKKGTVVAGNPIRVIGTFEEFEEKRKHYKQE